MLTHEHERLKQLLARYADGSIGSGEAEELSRFLRDDRYDEAITGILSAMADSVVPEEADAAAINRMILRVREAADERAATPVKRLPLWVKLAAAAVIVGVCSIGGYFLLNDQQQPAATVQRYRNDVQPGGNRAMLTLSDGSTISLDDAQQGTVMQQGGMQAVKTAEGELSYSGQSAPGEAVQYNTLTTPVGGQYRITLPDGTGVWLNAGSSLRYPTAFTGHARNVELTGEAYFEIAKDASKPFFVRADNQLTIEVLGTRFNVQAYADDQRITTTLLQGAVNVRKDGQAKLLAPGQQAVSIGDNTVSVLHDADTESAVAWKNGLFRFDEANIETVMKQLSRWYGISVVYRGAPVKEYFTATIPRNVPVSKVFELLELTGLVHFEIEGKQVTVTP
ncbi:DUF4974 domain-containing protein [Chitinophaga lutea]|uniref:DUF4974 domain-containing protein n=1 Tax=Chitinophaga lutea TaxID=2488634 RepID=A0A3N4Q585_9BACT|nr:FecR domain-containing protein [Chitinophaga lutea]RPE12671.1 DUF4974 domain-containing protein [Chitinophaga lutea]